MTVSHHHEKMIYLGLKGLYSTFIMHFPKKIN